MTEATPVGASPAATEPAQTQVAPVATEIPAATHPAEGAEGAEAAQTETNADGSPKEPLRDPVSGQFVTRHARTEKLVSQIGDLTRTKHDLSREIAKLRNDATALQKQLQEQPQLDPADFAGQMRHDVKTALKEERLVQTVDQIKALQQQEEQAVRASLNQQVAELRTHIPDIDSIYLPVEQGGPVISQAMYEAIARVENGALVAYHLKGNRAEAARISGLDPWAAATEIGKIAANVKPAPVRRVSQAPQPVQTVSGAPGNPSPDLGSLSFRDYERVMNEKELARRA